jgi:CheY-like chemotaxis protein
MNFQAPQCVLLAEDDPVFTAQIHKVFSQMPQPWQVHTAQNGEAAMRAHKARHLLQPFTLAVIDIGLPDMSGVEVISALHQSSPQIPILAASNFRAEDTFLSTIQAGAHGYLLKSDADAALLDALGFDPASLEVLQSRTGWDTARLQAQLMALELRGQVGRLPGGLFQRKDGNQSLLI